MNLSDRLRGLDEKVLGRPVPDVRPLSQRLLRPRPAVWSGRGRFLYGLILIGMFVAVRWGDALIGTIVLVPLFAAALLVSASDERRRAKQFYGDDHK